MSIGVYKITSPTNKIYIGQSINIERRYKEYSKSNCKNQTKLFLSLKKHGFENHKFEIIEECDVSILEERETYWKLFYKVLEIPSLCCRIDGKFGYDSIETKNKKSQSKLNNNYALGHIKSLETINSIKDKMKNHTFYNDIDRVTKLSNSHSIPVLQYDKQGNFIKEWESAKEAAKVLKNKINGSDIRACIRGEQKTAYGYKWIEK
jgi:group I intron endonuclease